MIPDSLTYCSFGSTLLTESLHPVHKPSLNDSFRILTDPVLELNSLTRSVAAVKSLEGNKQGNFGLFETKQHMASENRRVLLDTATVS